MTNKTWNPKFAPSYTPEEMLELGVFEGKYINAVEGVPAAWKKIPKVLKPEDAPNPKINKYGVKSRQPLSTWKKNGWIKSDKWGWFTNSVVYSNIILKCHTHRLNPLNTLVGI